MRLDEFTKSLFIQALSKRIDTVQEYEIMPAALPTASESTTDSETVLSKLMVKLRHNPDQFSDEVFAQLQLIVFSAKSEDLRFLDAFHFYFEHFSKKEDVPDRWPHFLSTYLALLMYHMEYHQQIYTHFTSRTTI